jgi:threonine/homoserine/homoserine lactone efflux protein
VGKWILIGTVVGIVVLGSIGLLIADTGSDANEEASSVYLIVVGIATFVAAAYLIYVALKSRRRRDGRRPVRNDATRS